MAFLKFSRDKRGYENFYLLQPTARGKSRPRLLYWFHTPPNVKVGRTPFDPDVRRALEAQNPDVTFDWTAITQTPIPPPDTERWRERRRVERAMRTAAEADSIDEAESGQEARAERPVEAQAPIIVETTAEPLPVPPPDLDPVATADAESASKLAVPEAEATGVTPARRRKRRRRGRRKGPSSAIEVSGATSTGETIAQADAPENDSETAEDENLEP